MHGTSAFSGCPTPLLQIKKDTCVPCKCARHKGVVFSILINHWWVFVCIMNLTRVSSPIPLKPGPPGLSPEKWSFTRSLSCYLSNSLIRDAVKTFTTMSLIAAQPLQIINVTFEIKDLLASESTLRTTGQPSEAPCEAPWRTVGRLHNVKGLFFH